MIRTFVCIVFGTVAVLGLLSALAIGQVPDNVIDPVEPPEDTGVQYASPTVVQPNFATQAQAQTQGEAALSALTPGGQFFGMAFSKGPDSWYDPPGDD
ncbi:MAG TPA: hypothetical protein VKW76_16070 [Candidatus Binatia bacterium]|nr:hypothetical protein [Candidatus Binatia bacterium]